MNLAKLRLEARERGIPGYSRMSKAELLEALYGIEEDHRNFDTLRFAARVIGIPGYSTMCRAQLIKLLREKDEDEINIRNVFTMWRPTIQSQSSYEGSLIDDENVN